MKSKWILTTVLMASMAGADTAYIKEVQGLIDTLPSKDSTRVSLTLKLADAQFEEYLRAANAEKGGAAAEAGTATLRHTIIKNYKLALSGFDGLFTPLSGGLKGKVQFQLARLYNDDGKSGEAEKIWQGLVSQDAMADLKRESALRLAENLENRGGPADLKLAETYYQTALKLCTTQDVCSYAHYRLAWVNHKQDRVKDAVTEVKLALWDSKGQIREEALRDYVSFLALIPGNGKDTLNEMEELSAKIQRPTLIHDLAEALFAAGNREAGVYILESSNKKSPSLKNYARILEEQYGFRNWTAVNDTLDEMTAYIAKTPEIKKEALADAETEKIVRRLTVQLDGERNTQASRAPDFKKAVLIYLSLFDNLKTRNEMIDGWLVAETIPAQKMAQLKIWIAEEVALKQVAEEIKLREKRASEAQKDHQLEVVAEEMAALRKIDSSPAKRREDEYQEAHAAYDLKNYDAALPLFRELAEVKTISGTPDKWAILSENLALDILNQKKLFPEMITQAELFTQHPQYEAWITADKAHAEELRDLKKISLQAQFELASKGGETAEALKTFRTFCEQNQFTPKSCDNARVLSVKLKDESSLLTILKIQNKSDELASEYEAAAQYVEAARLLEPGLQKKDATTRDYLKVALLYELGTQLTDRDRILTLLTVRLSKASSMGVEEELLYATLRDAKLINAAALKLPWTKDNHKRLVAELEASGKGTAETHQALLTSCENLGPAWTKVALAQLKGLDEKQRAIKFYGKQSKRKFEARMAALKKLGTQADCSLQGADAKTRVIMATELAQAQFDLADEVKNSPLPEGMDAQSQEQLKAALVQMAEPFMIKGKSFADLASAQLEKLESPEERATLKEKIEKHQDLTIEAVAAAPRAPADQSPTTMKIDVKSDLQALHKNPNEETSLVSLQKYYEGLGQPRLAAYYQGRILQMKSPQTAIEGDKK